MTVPFKFVYFAVFKFVSTHYIVCIFFFPVSLSCYAQMQFLHHFCLYTLRISFSFLSHQLFSNIRILDFAFSILYFTLHPKNFHELFISYLLWIFSISDFLQLVIVWSIVGVVVPCQSISWSVVGWLVDLSGIFCKLY